MPPADPRASSTSPTWPRQSACHWCFKDLAIEPFARLCASLGLGGIDFVGPEHAPLLRSFGLIPTLLPSHDLQRGLNRVEHHAECLAKIRTALEAAAEVGAPSVVCFSGNRAGLDDAAGFKNCAAAIKQVVSLAEAKGVTLCLELLNSKRDHVDYMADRTVWGAAMVRSIGSERFKLLYDIYHMQIQEGDVIATIREFSDCIGHYHTGGVPGRHEIDARQELNYPAIIKAIADTGYRGWIAHEFIPTDDPATALRSAIAACSPSSPGGTPAV